MFFKQGPIDLAAWALEFALSCVYGWLSSTCRVANAIHSRMRTPWRAVACRDRAARTRGGAGGRLRHLRCHGLGGGTARAGPDGGGCACQKRGVPERARLSGAGKRQLAPRGGCRVQRLDWMLLFVL